VTRRNDGSASSVAASQLLAGLTTNPTAE